jgi:hypothetical protein
VAAHAEQHDFAREAGGGAQLRRDQHARRAVDLHVHRVAEEDALPAGRFHRERGHAVTEGFPGGPGKDQQRPFRVLGDGELVDVHRGQDLAVTRRHGDTPFAVQRQRCWTLEHDVCHKNPLKCTYLHCSSSEEPGSTHAQRKNQWNQGLSGGSSKDETA